MIRVSRSADGAGALPICLTGALEAPHRPASECLALGAGVLELGEDVRVFEMSLRECGAPAVRSAAISLR
jgi:hypothetical protein